FDTQSLRPGVARASRTSPWAVTGPAPVDASSRNRQGVIGDDPRGRATRELGEQGLATAAERVAEAVERALSEPRGPVRGGSRRGRRGARAPLGAPSGAGARGGRARGDT